MLEKHLYAGTDHPLPVIAIHSSELLGQDAANHLAALSGRRVFALSPAVSTDVDCFEKAVDAIEEFRQAEIASRVVFWGISGGGWLGLLYAQRYPEGLSGLILESACGNFRRRLEDPECAMGLEGESIVSPEPLTERMATTKAAMLAFDALGWLDEVRAPTLVLAGENDKICPARQSALLAEGLPGAHFVQIDGADHLPITTGDPTAQRALRRWFETLEHGGEPGSIGP